jgi:hypothetical protein
MEFEKILKRVGIDLDKPCLFNRKEDESDNDFSERIIVVDALYSYLSAGTKEERKSASIKAKAAYKLLTGNDYKNPPNKKRK